MAGTGQVEEVINVRRKLSTVELELAKSSAERVKILTEELECFRTLEKRIEAMYEGKVGPVYLQVKAERLETQIALTRARALLQPQDPAPQGAVEHNNETLKQVLKSACENTASEYLMLRHLKYGLARSRNVTLEFQQNTLEDILNEGAVVQPSILLPTGRYKDGELATEHERSLFPLVTTAGVNERSNDENEVEGDLLEDSFVYYRAFRAKESCIICHRAIGEKLDVGDLMGVVKLTVQK